MKLDSHNQIAQRLKLRHSLVKGEAFIMCPHLKARNRILSGIADLTPSDKNKAKIEETIHNFIGEKSRLGKCSADWKKARVQIKENPKMKAELIAALKALA